MVSSVLKSPRTTEIDVLSRKRAGRQGSWDGDLIRLGQWGGKLRRNLRQILDFWEIRSSKRKIRWDWFVVLITWDRSSRGVFLNGGSKIHWTAFTKFEQFLKLMVQRFRYWLYIRLNVDLSTFSIRLRPQKSIRVYIGSLHIANWVLQRPISHRIEVPARVPRVEFGPWQWISFKHVEREDTDISAALNV